MQFCAKQTNQRNSITVKARPNDMTCVTMRGKKSETSARNYRALIGYRNLEEAWHQSDITQ